MSKTAVLVFVAACGLRAAVVPMTLRQAVQAALRQNPDLALARLDEEKARQAIRVAHDPFSPKLTVGSGLAYTNGFPMSIEGAAPSIVQTTASEYLFNRPQSYLVAQARENARTAQLSTAAKQEDVAYQVTSLFLDAGRAARIGELARQDAQNFEAVLAAVQARVGEGRALPLAEKQAELNLARARQTADSLEADQETAETALAMALGYGPQDRVRAVSEERPVPSPAGTQEEVIEKAFASSKELRRIESEIAAKGLERRGERAARLPRVDLVAQYSILGRYNNYAEFFSKFQRNNVELGASFQLPLLTGPGVSAQMEQTEADIMRLRNQLNSTRNRISTDIQQSYRDVKKSDTAAQVAQLDLDVSREQVSVLLSQMQEGRATLTQVQEARVTENGKWMAFYDAQYASQRARWNLLRLSGDLLSSLGFKP